MNQSALKSPAQLRRIAARERAGLTVQQAANRVNICEAYLQRIERHGKAPFEPAMRLSRVYDCSAMLFL